MSTRTTIDLLQGTLSVLVLKALTWGPMHGYGIARRIESTASDSLLVEEGSLYPTLHRLESQGLVSAEWRVSSTNRRVKTYTITLTGRERLKAEMAQWDRFAAAVTRVLGARRPTEA